MPHPPTLLFFLLLLKACLCIDVAVIGGGLSGINAGLEIQREVERVALSLDTFSPTRAGEVRDDEIPWFVNPGAFGLKNETVEEREVGMNALASAWRRLLPTVQVTVIEATDRFGGRAATMGALGEEDEALASLEVGASMFLGINSRVMETAREAGLRVVPHTDGRPPPSGLLASLLSPGDPSLVWLRNNSGSLSLSHCLSLSAHPTCTLQTLVTLPLTDSLALTSTLSSLVANFTTSPTYTDPDYAATSLHDWLTSSGLESFVGASASALSSSPFLRDNLVGGALRANYAQDVEDASALAALITLIALTSPALEIAGGNQQLASAQARAILNGRKRLGTRVATVTRRTHASEGTRPQYFLRSDDGSFASATAYDGVLVAAPLSSAPGFDFLAGAEYQVRVEGALRSSGGPLEVHVTFVTGELRPEAGGPDVGTVLTTADAGTPFVALSRVRHEPPVYKLFSRAPLSDADLDPYFTSRSAVRRHTWPAAFPHLVPRTDLADLTFDLGLDDPVVAANVCELAVSTMETQLLCARNAAKLLVRRLVRALALRDAESATRSD
jgi:hypothetical protein